MPKLVVVAVAETWHERKASEVGAGDECEGAPAPRGSRPQVLASVVLLALPQGQ